MSDTRQESRPVVAVVGLGYVGLPLAVEFGKKCPTIGFDLSQTKIDAYQRYIDLTGEVAADDLKAAVRDGGLEPTSDPRRITNADFLIIAVPTPVDDAHIPDFGPLIGASATAGQHMKKGAIVIYESTVYPGATEEICIPVLEKYSALKWKQDFHVGYSPERINPGDKEHTLTKILKAISGDSSKTMEKVAALYASIVHRATSIKVAEAARQYLEQPLDNIFGLMKPGGVFTDIKSVFDAKHIAGRGFHVWRL